MCASTASRHARLAARRALRLEPPMPRHPAPCSAQPGRGSGRKRRRSRRRPGGRPSRGRCKPGGWRGGEGGPSKGGGPCMGGAEARPRREVASGLDSGMSGGAVQGGEGGRGGQGQGGLKGAQGRRGLVCMRVVEQQGGTGSSVSYQQWSKRPVGSGACRSSLSPRLRPSWRGSCPCPSTSVPRDGRGTHSLTRSTGRGPSSR